MNTLAKTADERVSEVRFTADSICVGLQDGRTIIAPLAWYPRLLDATKAQRNNWKIAGGGYGIHWPDIDEDLSTEGLLRGAPAPGATQVTENPVVRAGEVFKSAIPENAVITYAKTGRRTKNKATSSRR